jgi:sigma-E factor negative regulatory protein RseB
MLCPMVAALMLLAVAQPARTADVDAVELVVRMAEAMRTESYAGDLVYVHGNSLESLHVVHGFRDGVEHERLDFLTGEPFEIVRRGEQFICVWPAKKRALIDRRPGETLAPKPPRDLRALPPEYTAEFAGSGRMAGRAARVVRIRGHDQYRYGYRMWIGRAQHLLLRSDLLDADGMVYERLMFTSVRALGAVDAGRFEPSLDGLEYMRHGDSDDSAPAVEAPAWRVTDAPPGFELVSRRGGSIPGREGLLQHDVFSDGLASVSVFVESMGPDDVPIRGVSRMGAVHAFGRTLHGHQVTVVGEVPEATVRRIAASIERLADG